MMGYNKIILILLFCLFNVLTYSNKQNKELLIKEIQKEKDVLKKIDLMLSLSFLQTDTDSVSFFNQVEKIRTLSISNNYNRGIAEYYYLLGDFYYKKAKFKISNINYEKAISYFRISKNEKRIADAYTCIAVNFSELSMYSEAIEPYIKSEEIYYKLHDTTGLIQSYINIGASYNDIKLDKKGTTYLLKAVELATLVKDYESLAYCYSNLGIYAKKNKDYNKALEYYIKLEYFAEQTLNKYLSGIAYNHLTYLFLEKKEPYKAIQFAKKYSNLYKNSTDPLVKYQINILYGDADVAMGKNEEAILYLKKAFDIAKKINTGNLIINASNELAIAYKNLKYYDKAFYYKDLAYYIADSIFKVDNIKQITELETKYQTEKKEQEIEVLNKNKIVQKLEIEKKQKEIKQRNIIIFGIAILLIIIIGFSVVVYRTLQQKRKANKLLNQKNNEIQQKNEEILSQRDEIQAQRDEVILHRDKIASQQKKITDSILYASRIQNAVLPPLENINILLPEHFILFKPRDIVSGDFYWVQQIKNRTYIAVADCTGHGVPGAFMSMLGVAFLNEIITKFNNPTAGDILNQLRINVKRSLHQTGRIGEQKDGMDISLCVIDKDKNQLEFSGANNPLYIVSSKQSAVGSKQSAVGSKQPAVSSEMHELPTTTASCQLLELKGDKMPIGVYTTDDKLFNTQYYSYNTGDTFYMFSDGYVDQFGGIDGKKFMKSRFKKFLLEINNLSVNEQQKQLEYNIERWMGNNEQVDDILVVGVRFA